MTAAFFVSTHLSDFTILPQNEYTSLCGCFKLFLSDYWIFLCFRMKQKSPYEATEILAVHCEKEGSAAVGIPPGKNMAPTKSVYTFFLSDYTIHIS